MILMLGLDSDYNMSNFYPTMLINDDTDAVITTQEVSTHDDELNKYFVYTTEHCVNKMVAKAICIIKVRIIEFTDGEGRKESLTYYWVTMAHNGTTLLPYLFEINGPNRSLQRLAYPYIHDKFVQISQSGYSSLFLKFHDMDDHHLYSRYLHQRAVMFKRAIFCMRRKGNHVDCKWFRQGR